MIHIHNGDVALALAKRSNIPGDHIAFRESLITGPVGETEDWIEMRAQALAEAHQNDLLRVRTDLVEQEQLLDAAASQDEVVLWFEHDLFCLVHLLYLLQRFKRARLSLVWCSKPIGENDERSLHLLFDSRAAVTPSMIAVARDVWKAYTSADPTSLNVYLDRERADFPFLREGITLHASRFPSMYNGLGAIEQQALHTIATGTTDFPTLFDRINAGLPRFGFGDSEVFRLLRWMAWRAVPLITVTGELPKAIFSITPAGENVLAAEVDDTTINDPDLWLGGTHLTRGHLWRWDGSHLSRSAES
ncbi:MAG TPA: DUF1835 domain-containing protein [Thermoanaerobaculia bacterium]|nr:DUF1835 domain-containing protein [Thermoanaerobaculia bacterium]